MTKLHVKVVPGASRTRIVGWLGTELKVTVTAPPELGKANVAVLALLASSLGVVADDILLVSGHSNPHKVFEFSRLSTGELSQKLVEAGVKGRPGSAAG